MLLMLICVIAVAANATDQRPRALTTGRGSRSAVRKCAVPRPSRCRPTAKDRAVRPNTVPCALGVHASAREAKALQSPPMAGGPQHRGFASHTTGHAGRAPCAQMSSRRNHHNGAWNGVRPLTSVLHFLRALRVTLDSARLHCIVLNAEHWDHEAARGQCTQARAGLVHPFGDPPVRKPTTGGAEQASGR